MDLSTLKDRISVVAVDMDGTLLRPDSTLSERTVRAFAECRARGVAAVIATGRSPRAVTEIRSRLGATGPQIYYNGAAVVDEPSGRTLSTTPLAAEVVRFCVGLSRRRDLHLHAFLPNNDMVYERAGPELDAYCRRTTLVGIKTDLEAAAEAQLVEGFIKCMFIAEPETLIPLERTLAERFGSSIYTARTTRTFLEVMAAGVSKGVGLRSAMAFRGLDLSRSIAFGDEDNDLPLLEAAGVAVAMANGIDAAKEKADYVAPPNSEDGVAATLEKIFGF